MHWLSQSAEALIGKCTNKSSSGGTLDAVVDVAVVGSGYGGAVAALRFAEHGQSVYVLERGQEFVAGEFPNDLSQIGKHVRSEQATETGVTTQGYEDALFDFRIGLRAGALVGNGLGGGSLINAGVGLQPDNRVFKQDDWPAALRQENLDQWFKCARSMHELQTPGQPAQGNTQTMNIRGTAKYQRMQDMAASAQSSQTRPKGDKGIHVSFEPAPIAVQLDSPAPQNLGPRQPCIGCGDCVTGCNYQAKLSLTATYLPRAVKAGASLFTGLTVLHVSLDREGNKEFPWVVHFIRTGERKLQHEIERHTAAKGEHAPAADSRHWVYALRARHVVLGAGTFGSTEIMLRSRAKGLSLSNTALGVGVSGNGDDVAYGYDLQDKANAVGWGSKEDQQPLVGPTISSVIRFTDPSDVKRSTLVQDGALPGLMQGVVHELLTTMGTLAQMGHARFRSRDGGDPLALKPAALRRSLALLGMGHDTAGGAMAYHAKADRMTWGWPKAADEATPALHKMRMKPSVEKLGGLYIQNPAVSVIPDSMSSVLTGPKPGGSLFTVHPLGGCRMGDTAVNGVVNHYGAVWTADGELHHGLYVMDGSTIPSALGANPMLTITALAERACEMILKGIDQQAVVQRSLGAYPQGPTPLKVASEVHSSARLAEVLRGELTLNTTTASQDLPENLQALLVGKSKLDAALFLEFDVPHWQGLFDDLRHTVRVVPAKEIPGQRYTASRLVLDGHAPNGVGVAPPSVELLVTGGWVDFFCQRHDGWWQRTSRWLRTGCTYLLSRWLPDLKKNGCNGESTLSESITGALKLIGHANEVREFCYEITLIDGQNKPYTLRGKKVIQAAASWPALFESFLSKGWTAPKRRSLWQQLTEIQMDLIAGSAGDQGQRATALVSGRLAMDLPDMLRRVMPQISANRDSLSALLELAGYPMLLLRAMLKMRLLDFTAPDYKKDLPDTDPALIDKPQGYFELEHIPYPDLPGKAGAAPIQAGKPQMIQVPLTSRSDGEDPELIRLGLVRYPQETLTKTTVDKMHRVKTIVLLNGFDLSTKPFVAEELNRHGGNLATQLHHAGWDVWLFEYRASPLLDASARYSTMDDIAAFDIPAAVRNIICTVSGELKIKEHETQIFAFSHCVGSATLAMSLLSGYLRHSGGQPQLAGVIFSQFHPLMVGSATAQMRLQLAAFLSTVLKLETLQFTAGTAQANLLYAMMDRLFASANYAPPGDPQPGDPQRYRHEAHSECCPQETDLSQYQPASTTCKRMSGLLSPLFEHGQLLPETHKKLDQYFGRSNLGVFLHGAKCVQYERLVNADGQNVYVSEQAIKDHLCMPLMLLHGERNALFDKESFERTFAQLVRLFDADQLDLMNQQLNVPDNTDIDFSIGKNRGLRVAGHAHFDCTIGKEAPKRIFPKVVNFFDAAFQAPSTQQPAYKRCRARLARTGPIVGWVRPGPGNTTLIRVWIEVDDTHADTPVAALTVLKYGNEHKVQAWRVQTQSLASQASENYEKYESYKSHRNHAHPYMPVVPKSPRVMYAVADLEVPDAALDLVELQMVSIHSYDGPRSSQPPTAGYLPEWGVPMTMEDVTKGSGPGFTTSHRGMAETSATPVFGTSVPLSHTIPLKFPLQGDVMQQMASPGFKAAQPPSDPAKTFVSAARTAQDLKREWPLDLAHHHLDDEHFLPPLEADVKQCKLTTRMAEPGTLSRQRRTLRNFNQALVRLTRYQLQELDNGCLSFFAAACRHPGLTGFEFERADASLLNARKAIDSAKPRFMLMLGDQIYADARAGLLDTQSPIEKLLPRYRDAFGSSSGFRKLAQRLPLYMVIDDHEINDDWSLEQAQTGSSSRVLASNAMDAFSVFQYAHGPGLPADLTNPTQPVLGFNYSYNHGGFPFIVLDTRTQRSRVPERRILHASQWRWLEQWLLAEQVKGVQPKFIVSGSVLAPGLLENSGYPAPRSADNWQMSPGERQRLLSFIADKAIDNVVFVSSDYHCAAAATITFTHSKVKAWAIVAPPLHAPMRFANVQTSDMLPHERIELLNGAALVDAEAWDGEGWLECEVERQDANAYELRLRFWLRQLEQADWPNAPIERNWVLAGTVQKQQRQQDLAKGRASQTLHALQDDPDVTAVALPEI